VLATVTVMMPVVGAMTVVVINPDEPLGARRLNKWGDKEENEKRDKRKYLHPTCDAIGLSRVCSDTYFCWPSGC
jgi:hypothetical protein